jgi:hypothetical protein
MSDINKTGGFRRLFEGDEYRAVNFRKDVTAGDEEIQDRIFWDQDSLKYEFYHPEDQSVEAIEMDLGDGEACYYTLGGPTMYSGKDVSSYVDLESELGDDPSVLIEDLETASFGGRISTDELSEFMYDIMESTGREIADEIESNKVMSNTMNLMGKFMEYCRGQVPPEDHIE